MSDARISRLGECGLIVPAKTTSPSSKFVRANTMASGGNGEDCRGNRDDRFGSKTGKARPDQMFSALLREADVPADHLKNSHRAQPPPRGHVFATGRDGGELHSDIR